MRSGPEQYRLRATVAGPHSLLLAAALGAACSAEPNAAPPPRPTPTPPATTPGASAPDLSSTEPTVPPIPAALDESAKRLGAKFRAGKRCDTAALAQLRELRAQYGVQSNVGKALALAFRGCDEKDAYAELFSEMLGTTGTDEERLKLGAAWLRATRYERAKEVLLPLAESSGPTTQAAWLAGFALFHAGDPEAALPWLEGARQQTATAKRADAPILIGLSKLHIGDTQGAIEELEAGVRTMPEHPGVKSALSRAYAQAGRTADSERLAAESQAASDTLDRRQRDKLRLSALSTAFRNARSEKRDQDADALIDTMLPIAPIALKKQLLEQRVAMYTEAGRSKDAARVRKQLTALDDKRP